MKYDIIFLDGIVPRHTNLSFLGYIFDIASVLEAEQYNFKILNPDTLSDYTLSGLIQELKNHDFSTIGMTTNAENIRFVYQFSKEIKKEFPSVLIILGGPQVTYSDEKVLDESDCDIIVRHEGEDKIIKILQEVRKSEPDLSTIPGITYKKGNKIYKNNDGVRLNLNKLPIPQYRILTDSEYWIIPEYCSYKNFDSFLKKVRKDNSHFMTSRGCPNKCLFCVEGNKKDYMLRTVENVERDLEYFIQTANPSTIGIADDTFTSSPKRIKEICGVFSKLSRKYGELRWYAEARVDVLSQNHDLIKLMFDSGLRELQIGIESGNQRVLDIYQKRITVEQIEDVVKEVSKYDIWMFGNIIMGNPTEKMSDFFETLEFVKKLHILSNFKIDISFSYLTPFAGIPICINPKKYGIDILIDNFEFKRRGMNSPICKPQEMNHDEIESLYGYAHTLTKNFLQTEFRKLPKNVIDSNFRLTQGKNSITISKAIGLNIFFDKYKNVILHHSSISSHDYSSDYMDLYPNRLWDIEYDAHISGYKFRSLTGEFVEMNEWQSELWELASGKNTIKEIVNLINDVSIADVINFYKFLEEKLAIVFRMI